MRKLGFLSLILIGACGGSGSTPPPIDAGQDLMPQPDRPPPDAPTNEAGNYCAPATGAGTIHDKDITATETWKASDSPHIVKGEINVGGATLATLLIDGCAVVKFDPGAGLKIAADGKRGAIRIMPSDFLHPVTLTGSTETNGSWKGIYIGPGTGADDDSKASIMKYFTIDYAGGDAGRAAPAAIFVEGSKKYAPAVEMDGAKIRHSAGYGIYATADGSVRAPAGGGSIDVTMNDGAPVRIEAEHVGTLPAGTYSGNMVDEVEVQGASTPCVCSADGTQCAPGLCVRTSTNWPRLGVPFHIKGLMHIGKSVGGLEKAITITIPDGVQFKMAPDSGIAVGVDSVQKGALRLQGSKTAPVVFKPDKDGAGAGSWRGVMYGLYSDWEGEGSRIYFTEFHGAGQAFTQAVPKTCGTASIDGKQGAVIFNMVDPSTKFPPTFDPSKFADISNSTFEKCSGHAIVRGWDSTTEAPDFTAAGKMNTFTDIAGCKQTNPQMSGSCSPCTM